jgi:hypothetical protein
MHYVLLMAYPNVSVIRLDTVRTSLFAHKRRRHNRRGWTPNRRFESCRYAIGSHLCQGTLPPAQLQESRSIEKEVSAVSVFTREELRDIADRAAGQVHPGLNQLWYGAYLNLATAADYLSLIMHRSRVGVDFNRAYNCPDCGTSKGYEPPCDKCDRVKCCVAETVGEA